MKAVVLGFIALAWISPWLHAAGPRVVVRVEPAVITRLTFDPRNPPREMPKLTPPEVGTTLYSFRCRSELEIRGFRGRPARITGIQVTANLTVTIWTPRNGSPHILTHEEGHRAICEVYYGPAESIARSLAQAEVGRYLRSSVEQKAAAEEELKVVQDRLLAAFLKETASRCDLAQARFDAITDHSRNPVGESIAIKQALTEERSAYASAKTLKPDEGPNQSAVRPRRLPTRPGSAAAGRS